MEAIIMIAGFGMMIIMQGITLMRMRAMNKKPNVKIGVNDSDEHLEKIRAIKSELETLHGRIQELRPQPPPTDPKHGLFLDIETLLGRMKRTTEQKRMDHEGAA